MIQADLLHDLLSGRPIHVRGAIDVGGGIKPVLGAGSPGRYVAVGHMYRLLSELYLPPNTEVEVTLKLHIAYPTEVDE